jgi:hypothetical protein
MRRTALALTLVAAMGVLGLLSPALASETLVQHFTLEQMTSNSGMVLRGEVMDVIPGTVLAGGSELPTVTYIVKVNEAFKGTFETKGDVQYAEIRMLGNLKSAAGTGAVQRRSILDDVPALKVGQEYVLMVTPPSSAGLSTTVGLGQGCFEIEGAGKTEMVSNAFGNAGLFAGPISYQEMANRIQQLVNR